MITIMSDNQNVARALEKNVALAASAGATFNDDLVITCVDGALSVEAPPDRVGQRLIRLPWDCLLPIELFVLGVVGEDVVIRSHENGLSSACVMQLEALLELYNVAGKLASHRRSTPWALLANNPELFTHIRRRIPDDLARLFTKFQASRDADILALDTFLHTRAFDYREIETWPPCPVLLPIIELLNHHLQGAPVELEQANGDTFLTMRRCVPIPGRGNECFAFYGLYDPFDTFMSYGFIDTMAPFVRSVPMEIELPKLGSLRIANFVRIRAQQDLPPSLSDIPVFIPRLLAKRDRELEVASLLLPPPHMSNALRRALALLIAEIDPRRQPDRDLVLQAEAQIIEANRAYYINLLATLRSLTPKDPQHAPIVDRFVQVCGRQLTHVQDYANYASG